MWKISNLTVCLLACMIFQWVTFRWELEIHIYVTTWLQLENLPLHFFCWFMDRFFSPLLTIVMQWTTVGNMLTVLASFVVFCCSFLLLLGKETCTKSTAWWKIETFYGGLLLELIVSGNSVNLPIWAYLETIAFQILSQVAYSIVAFNHSVRKKKSWFLLSLF